MHFHQWKRREFITLLCGAAAWPVTARAQQGERVRRVVFLHALPEGDPEALARVTAFRREVETLGWKEGRNIEIVHRFSGADVARIQVYVTELVSSAGSKAARSQSSIARRKGGPSGSPKSPPSSSGSRSMSSSRRATAQFWQQSERHRSFPLSSRSQMTRLQAVSWDRGAGHAARPRRRGDRIRGIGQGVLHSREGTP